MLKVLNKAKELAFDVFWPKKCIGCGREGEYICDKCSIFLSESVNNIDKLVSIWEYEGIMKKLIYHIKYEGQTHIVNELVEKAFKVIAKDTARFEKFLNFLLAKDTYITYVPMYKKKEKQRGFNQVELIAKKVGKITKKETVPLLTKIKDNLSQTGLNYQERIENVKDVFSFREECTCPDNILVVDDFWISGATMKECFKILKQAGAKNIWGFALARIT